MCVQWRKENPNPRVHRSSRKLGEPRFPLERVDPRVGIFLSPMDTHDGFYLSHPRYLTPVVPCVQMFFFNTGCIGRHVISSLSAHVTMTSKRSKSKWRTPRFYHFSR